MMGSEQTLYCLMLLFNDANDKYSKGQSPLLSFIKLFFKGLHGFKAIWH